MSIAYLLNTVPCSYRQKKRRGMNQKLCRRVDSLSRGFHVTVKVDSKFSQPC